MDETLTKQKEIDYGMLGPLTERELHELAGYNGECSRGLVHTREWNERMKILQERFYATT